MIIWVNILEELGKLEQIFLLQIITEVPAHDLEDLHGLSVADFAIGPIDPSLRATRFRGGKFKSFLSNLVFFLL